MLTIILSLAVAGWAAIVVLLYALCAVSARADRIGGACEAILKERAVEHELAGRGGVGLTRG
jgi:hypothetical protein